jgi:predicted transcriptional regulator
MTKRARQQGELENLVLDVLWDSNEPLTSNEVLAHCNVDSDLALTTILTVLSRLVDKELVERRIGEGRSYLFAAAQSREQHTARQLLELINDSSNQALTLSHFTAGLSKKSVTALKKLLDEK